VASGAALNTWTHDVFNDIAALKTDLSALDVLLKTGPPVGTLVANIVALNTFCAGLGGGPFGPPGTFDSTLTPDTTDGINTDVDHSYVSSGSAKVEVEP
jgi:hypothetical protein